MSDCYSDDEETLELQEEEQSNRNWSANASSERIRRSRASTDIAALMDTEMDEDSGREEMEEHTEALPQTLIEYFKDKFNCNAMQCNNRWTQPIALEPKFKDLLRKAVDMCEAGHADGTVDLFVNENLSPLFRKWYYSGDAYEHWNAECFHDMGEVIYTVIRMLRGLLIAGSGNRDIPVTLWELFVHATHEFRVNLWVGDRLHQMNIDVDESQETELLSSQQVNTFVRFVVLAFDVRGLRATQKFFDQNITKSTSIEEFNKYFKAFKTIAIHVSNDKAFTTFANVVFSGMDRLANASEEELSCKNLRGPLLSHPLFDLYAQLVNYVVYIYDLHVTNDNIFTLFRWRLKFCLKALNEAPFNGRMGAVESIGILMPEFVKFVQGDRRGVLAKWLEEERAVDMLTRDNLHNVSYVDRVQRACVQMLNMNIFTPGDLSTVWEAQRGKHDVIQRNLADLIVHIVPHFDNDLLEALYLKIMAGWVDGGVKERGMLIDIVRRIGETSAYNMNARRGQENDVALISKSLHTLWMFIRQPGACRENEESALQAHLKLLDDSRSTSTFVQTYAEMCTADIAKESVLSATAAGHLVHILELVSDDEEEDEDDYGSSSAGRHDLIGSLENNHDLVQSLCANIAKTVARGMDSPDRGSSLAAFLQALGFVLNQNRDFLRLTEQQASELWEALICNPLCAADMCLGFKFFLNVVESEVMDKPMLVRFFREYVLDLAPSKVTKYGYQCFEAFFKAVNYINGKDTDFYKNPDNLLGSAYVQQLMLQGQAEVYERATNLWVEYLQKIIDRVAEPAMTSEHVRSLVVLITSQYAEMAVCVREADARGLAPLTNPAYEMTKERTMRCIKVLSLLVNGMDDEVVVARRSEAALGKAAIGRPILVSCKVPRREWESVPYSNRGNARVDDLDNCVDMHENSSVAELRDCIKKSLLERIGRRRADAEDILEQFLLVHCSHEGAKTLHFTDYKRTLGEMGMGDVAEVEVRFNRSHSPRQGEISPDSSTTDSDWLSPEEMADDAAHESILPSKALAADERLIDALLKVSESEDVDIAMSAFQILTMVPQNGAMLAQLRDAVRDETRLRALLADASDARFAYFLMMLEAMILPADSNLRGEQHQAAINAMMMFIRVLPDVGQLNKLMTRSIAFRSLAILPITHILHLACMTAARVVAQVQFGNNTAMNSMITSLVRLQQIDAPPKWSKHIRVRRLSSVYTEQLMEMRSGFELQQLIESHSQLLLHVLCGVTLSAAAAYHSVVPLAEEGARTLAGLAQAPLPVLDEAAMDSDPCALPALMECAFYATSLLAAACPVKCATFIGAVAQEPDPVWIHALLASAFCKADNVRMMAWSLAIATVEAVRQSLAHTQPVGWDGGYVALTSSVLDLLPRCKGTGTADQFVTLIKELVHRSSHRAWDVTIVRLDEHITQGVEFLEQALAHSTTEQTPFPDETYLRARIEVLQMLIRHSTVERREWLGSTDGGPKLCERLLADFIFPAARAADAAAAAAAAADSAMGESDGLPRSSTHVEMNSSSSLFDLTAQCSLPRSLSALPISTRRVAVCSGEGSQDGAFQLLLALCDDVPQNHVLMQNTIHRLFYSNPWTDKKDFDYMPQHVLRQEGDLVGLKNGGATCYMNSIFQQLFMIDEVREAVLNATIPEKVLLERRTSDSSSQAASDSAAATAATPNRGDYAVKVLAAVQTLFAHLLGSELESYRPAEFWKVFNFKPNGESVNVREQQDAVEFHNMVTELIDEGLKKCGAEAMCEKTFRGVFADEKICKDCPHRYTKEEPFESLSLDVRSHNNLRDSLKEYVKGDVLENDNAYHCESCNKKVKAIKRMSLSKLPDVLIVQLKRFDFDWEKEISVKFNDYFEFPFEMDIQPYTLDGLEKLEKGLPLEDNRDYQYMLRGVVVHSGQAQGGHYTSYIRNRETGKWFKFDDNDVTPWEATENGAQQRWFGCTDNGQDSMGRGRRKVRTTYWNAYMLFYEKLETANRYLSVNPSSVASDMSTSSGVSSMTTTMTTIISSATTISPTPPPAATTAAAAAAPTGPAVSPTLIGEQVKSRSGKSVSPVSHLHRHFSSMSLSSARIRMPPRLEEMLREGNRRVQLERVQYSLHYFSFICAATTKALAMAQMHPEWAEPLMLATMKSFASFVVHNGLFASRDLMSDDPMQRISFKTWLSNLSRLLDCEPARLWLITHVFFSHEMAACFLFASDSNVRELFRSLILDTMRKVDEASDLSDACLRPAVTSPMANQLAQAVRQMPRLSHLLAHLLGILPFKHNAAFRAEPLDFYRTIIELADAPNMMVAMVRGGILNNLLTMFSPSHTQTDLSALHRKDPGVYEALHRVVADALRTVHLEPPGSEPNPYSDKQLIIRRTEVPDFKVMQDFLQKDGGQVKFLQHLIELVRRANRSSGDLHWVVDGVLFLCHEPVAGVAPSAIVMDIVCQTMGTFLNETATDWLILLLTFLFAIDDSFADARFEHLFHKVQLTSSHAQPSVQGLVEFASVQEARYEALIRVVTAAVQHIPDVIRLIHSDERVNHLLSQLRTVCMCKPGNKSFNNYLSWFAEASARASSSSEHETSDSVTESTGDDSTMEDESSERVAAAAAAGVSGGGGVSAPHSIYDNVINSSTTGYSPGQLSPSSRLGAMTISAGEKRPLPPMEDGEEDADGCGSGASDRKRSIGETMRGRVAWDAPPPRPTPATPAPANSAPPKIEDYAASPMDDRDLLISSSLPSTSKVVPSIPPPAYTEVMAAGAAAAASAAAAAAAARPAPPLPPRPAAAATVTATATAVVRQVDGSPKSTFDNDEFVVEKHKSE